MALFNLSLVGGGLYAWRQKKSLQSGVPARMYGRCPARCLLARSQLSTRSKSHLPPPTWASITMYMAMPESRGRLRSRMNSALMRSSEKISEIFGRNPGLPPDPPGGLSSTLSPSQIGQHCTLLQIGSMPLSEFRRVPPLLRQLRLRFPLILLPGCAAPAPCVGDFEPPQGR